MLTGVLSSCSDLTRVSAPDVVQPSDLNNAAGAELRRAGAIKQFAIGIALQVVSTGLISDEFTDRTGASVTVDQRRIDPATAAQEIGDYPWQSMSSAHVAIHRAIWSLELYAPEPRSHIGELFAFSGLLATMFAENLCQGVPYALFDGLQPASAPPMTRSQLLRAALVDFDSAKAYSGSVDSVTQLASVGRGRALLDSGDYAAAVTAVASVNPAFEYSINYDGVNQINYVAGLFGATGAAYGSVSDREGTNGLNFITASDPRIAIQNLGPIGSTSDTVYGVSIYSSSSAPIIAAGAIEARLIRAEALLASGNVAQWADSLNELRLEFPDTSLSSHPLGPDSTTNADGSERLGVMFRERAFWLFGTGHRHGDMRRLVHQYGRQPDNVFPTGTYQHGPLQYGSDVTFVPIVEDANSLFHGCANRDP